MTPLPGHPYNGKGAGKGSPGSIASWYLSTLACRSLSAEVGSPVAECWTQIDDDSEVTMFESHCEVHGYRATAAVMVERAGPHLIEHSASFIRRCVEPPARSSMRQWPTNEHP